MFTVKPVRNIVCSKFKEGNRSANVVHSVNKGKGLEKTDFMVASLVKKRNCKNSFWILDFSVI
ncbi:hypothetical protein DXN05_11200 [Deminuibacter soli]|uniref:Uncharacterized protein n=1 Tax=Deminuibacter soli TaxID=2291815 RepID=A0A3E1NJJ3_9BACT|nr:hypothetical protein DXN05_11200 [Deminuibacter soli]